jgi:hypothetical protein
MMFPYSDHTVAATAEGEVYFWYRLRRFTCAISGVR